MYFYFRKKELSKALWQKVFQIEEPTIPKRGIVGSKAWYCLFQSVVLPVPKRGTACSKAWNYVFQSVE
jgi:hypothetical protein